MIFQASLIILVVRACGTVAICGEVYEKGLTIANQNEAIDIHNKYREKIAKGQLTGQPKAINMKRMSYDAALEKAAKAVSAQCKLKHVYIEDDRFPSKWVGQNLYISWKSKQTSGQNWTTVVTSWFNEYKYFTYPNIKAKGKAAGHYTQVVWADSHLLGCDFISYYDKSKPKYPYAKLYICNYGPGGNWIKQAPYINGKTGCEDLC